jgi:hypothetical protein
MARRLQLSLFTVALSLQQQSSFLLQTGPEVERTQVAARCAQQQRERHERSRGRCCYRPRPSRCLAVLCVNTAAVLALCCSQASWKKPTQASLLCVCCGCVLVSRRWALKAGTAARRLGAPVAAARSRQVRKNAC